MRKGNAYIAEILMQEYGVKDLTCWEDIHYELQNLADGIQRVKITSPESKGGFWCPVYAMFDGYHMCWYGDYGSFVFDCTWKVNICNIAYGSPYYQLEKLRNRRQREFDGVKCREELLKVIKEGTWYKADLSDEQRTHLDNYLEVPYCSICYDDALYEHEETCEWLKNLLNSTDNEYEWVAAVNKMDQEMLDIVECEHSDLFDMGQKPPIQFFIMLYLLSVVANAEKEKKNGKIECR